MSHHYPSDASLYSLTKRIKFDAIQTGTVEVQFRQSLVRINFRISMSGKMFAYRQHSPIFQSSCIRYHFISHPLRVTTERTKINYRIQRIVIHICHRGKIHLHPHRMTLTGHLLAISIQQRIILYAPQHTVVRKRRCIFQPHSQSPFSIESYHQRYRSMCLRIIGQLYLFPCLSTGKQQSAHGIILYCLPKYIFIILSNDRLKSINKQLPHLLFQGHVFHLPVHPFTASRSVPYPVQECRTLRGNPRYGQQTQYHTA